MGTVSIPSGELGSWKGKEEGELEEAGYSARVAHAFGGVWLRSIGTMKGNTIPASCQPQ